MKILKSSFLLLVSAIILCSCGLLNELITPYDIGNFIDQYHDIKFRVESTYPDNKIKTLMFQKGDIVYVNDTLSTYSTQYGGYYYIQYFTIKSPVQINSFSADVEKISKNEFGIKSKDFKYVFKLIRL